MSKTHDYRYDLTVAGASEETLQKFAEAFQSTEFAYCMGQDPDAPETFTTEVMFGKGSGYFEDELEDMLHSLAVQFPDLQLYFTAVYTARTVR